MSPGLGIGLHAVTLIKTIKLVRICLSNNYTLTNQRKNRDTNLDVLNILEFESQILPYNRVSIPELTHLILPSYHLCTYSKPHPTRAPLSQAFPAHITNFLATYCAGLTFPFPSVHISNRRLSIPLPKVGSLTLSPR